jgi:RNA-directed DNA polymerase
MAGDCGLPEDWKRLPWKQLERNVFHIQQRIYQAARSGDLKRVHNLQRLLLKSWSARCLAVRRVSQDNRGKRTAGVDGVANLTPKQRLAYAHRLRDTKISADPVRRVYIPKSSNAQEKRPLGIPTLFQRAFQALVKMALEPEWEARFEPNSYGFRPGRSKQDAIQGIFLHICKQPQWVLDADIEKCFDRINHAALLDKLRAIQPIQRWVKVWLKATILDQGETLFPEQGTPQGGVISPLLANIALHGLERHIQQQCPKLPRPILVRYADDFVILHPDLDTLLVLQKEAQTWLRQIGLQLSAKKTRIRHTWKEQEGQVGFDFLGYTVRQFRVGKHRTATYRGQPGFKTIIKPSKRSQQNHLAKIREVIRNHRGTSQVSLIAELNPIIQGWTNSYRDCSAKKVFQRLDKQTYYKLAQWATGRHPGKTAGWQYQRYWKRNRGRLTFGDGRFFLKSHQDTPIQRFIKVRGEKSPFDGDWVYWSSRLGKDPTQPPKVTQALKRQSGKCSYCGLRFLTEDVLEIHHQDGNHRNNTKDNLALLHGHCHDRVHSTGRTNDNAPATEEPDDGKLSRPVLEWRWGERSLHRP